MVILISQDTSAVGLLVHGYINITGYICWTILISLDTSAVGLSLDTSAVGLLVYGYINITGYICCRTISLWLY